MHYRAQPGARGSGVERGHGQELPVCPLCQAKLDDVKYHKCSAGAAAQNGGAVSWLSWLLVTFEGLDGLVVDSCEA